MTQQNGNEQKQRQLAPGVGGQEQVRQPGQKDQQGQKDQALDAQREHDGSLEQGPKDLKNQPAQPGQGPQGRKGQADEGSSSDKR